MSDEVDVIQHLMEIEKEASAIILEAQKTADQTISQARTEAESQFKEKYSVIIDKIQKDEESRKEQILEKSQSALEEYKESLGGTHKNQEAFEGSLKAILSR